MAAVGVPGAILALLVTAGGLNACSADDATTSTRSTAVPSPTTGESTASAEPVDVVGVVVAEVEEPIMMLPRTGDDRLFIAERPGRIRTATPGEDGQLDVGSEPFLDLSDDTAAQGEQGLLGVAFSPDGAVMHVSYTNVDGDSRVDSWDIVDDAIDSASRRTIFELDQPFPNHNGGHLALDPDGELHLGLGDGGGADDPENRAQDDSAPFGKLLRLDPAGGEPATRVKGLRNPWRFDFDDDGTLWIADVGQFEWEEIDRIAADEIDGANLGWSGYEGSHLYLDEPDRVPDAPVHPIFEYDHSEGRCSITGGFVYRGRALPHLVGSYLFADLCEGQVKALLADGDEISAHDLDVSVNQPFSFGRDADDEAYVLSADGEIIALRAADDAGAGP